MAKYTLAKQEGTCMKGLRSTIGIYGFHEFKLWPFLNAPIRLGIIRSGTKLSLLTETLTGTLVELRDYPHKTSVFTLETSTGTVELRILKHGCLQSDNMATDLYHSGPSRDQFLLITMPTMLWIETHQPWARFVIHQLLTTMVVQIVWLSKSTLLPDEDLQCAVKTSWSISKWQSWDKW